MEYQLASAVHAFQRNGTHHKHSPSNNRKKEDPSFANELETSSQSEKSIYVQKTLVVGNIYSRSIWPRQIVQPLKLNLIEWTNS